MASRSIGSTVLTSLLHDPAWLEASNERERKAALLWLAKIERLYEALP
jgi:hypothetical protein